MGFRQFLPRSIDKVEGEWALAMLAYNCRRLNKLTVAWMRSGSPTREATALLDSPR